ncbi:catalytic protein [Coleophoma crateriformis]|uniref:Catalytic protein n=1 Tax=Coleophoma crateriformis TaxID=565419 RepID=A0A3D8QTL0_9HELO|nr:catalytic protein [Coleophoma crateriformis]
MFTLTTPLLALAAAASGLATPVQNGNSISPVSNLAGFQNAKPSHSAGGNAVCITGNVPVSVTTQTNEKILLSSPANQSSVTNLFVEYVQANSTLQTMANGGQTTVSGTYNINAKLCYPLNWDSKNSSKTIQFLIHGIGFDKSYWDLASGYSYVDAAAVAGYPTFSYDRLGTGASDHPDPIQVVQSSLQVDIAHNLIQFLRRGGFAGQSFSRVVAVGHSFGSIQSVGITVKYPKDADAVILTGFSTNTNAIPLTFVGFNPAIANQNKPATFGNLPNGYLVTDTSISNQLAFLRAPNFDPKLFTLDDATKQTFTLGEVFTLGNPVAPATAFTGPVDVVNGENDFIFCQSNCNIPTDQSVLVLDILYPAASKGSQTVVIPGTGHAINVHYEAPAAYQQMLNFVRSNGF